MNPELLAANLFAHWVQAGLITLAMLTALAVFRVREPRMTLALLQTVLLVVVLLPWAQPRKAVNVSQARAVSVPPSLLTTAPPVEANLVQARAMFFSSFPRFEPGKALLLAIGGGIVLRLMWLAYGGWCLMRFSRRAKTMPVPLVAQDLQRALGTSARYVQDARARGPSTFGIFRPTVVLPTECEYLSPSFQRAVVCHELLHVKRRDMAVSLAEELFAAGLWFHPWIWLLRDRIRIAREQVVDRATLEVIGNRDAYVECLVAMSGHNLIPHLSQRVTTMIRSRELRTRVDAIFRIARLSRARVVSKALGLCAVLIATGWIAVVCAPLEAIALPPPDDPPTQGPPPEPPRRVVKISEAEYPLEALDKGIAGTVVMFVTVNPAGEVTNADVLGGPEPLRASAKKASLETKYAAGPATTASTLALEYRVAGGRGEMRHVERIAADGIGFTGGPRPARQLGGSIWSPRKIKDVFPIYPDRARREGIEGNVFLELKIAPDGRVDEATVLRSDDPVLNEPAVEAAKQWQYEPTLENGVAVPVNIVSWVHFIAKEIQLRLILPNGTIAGVAARPGSDVNFIDLPGVGYLGFGAKRSEESSGGVVTVAVYELHDDHPTKIDSVNLTLGSGIVQTATKPAFGIELN